MFEIKFDKPFFELGDFPLTAINGSEPVAISNPWEDSGSNSAPFDKRKSSLTCHSEAVLIYSYSILPDSERCRWRPEWMVPGHVGREDVV